MHTVEITALLRKASAGDTAAYQDLIPEVYNDLRTMAARFLRSERAGHTLQATALVNEAWLRLSANPAMSWVNRNHFFAVASTIMRHVLIDSAKKKRAGKRGGGAIHVELKENLQISDESCDRIEALDPALQQLEKEHPRKARVVEMKFFAGMTEEEIGAVLGVSEKTVRRDWDYAKAYLHKLTSPQDVSSSASASR